MTAAKYDLEIDQGSSFSTAITVREDDAIKNLSGFAPRAQLRPSIDSADAEKTDFSFDISNLATGVIIMKLSHTVTENLKAGVYFYDLEIAANDGTTVTRLMQGKITVNPEVTR